MDEAQISIHLISCFRFPIREEGANCGILAPRADGGMDGIAGNPNNCKISSQGNAGTFGEVLKFLDDADLDEYIPGTPVNLDGNQKRHFILFCSPNQS